TFFCVGDNVRKFPEVYRQITEAGHLTGNHTYNHLNGWKSQTEAYLNNIAQCDELVKSDLFRPPYGKLSPRQALLLKQKNYRLIMWSLLSRDFERHLNTEESLKALIKGSAPGTIVVFHDSEKAEKNLKQLLPAYLAH